MITLSFFITQSIGAMAAIGDVYASTRKNDRNFMVIIAISSLIWGVHYALLGAWAAVGSDLLTSARYFSALYFKKAGIAYAFMGFYLLAIPITYETPLDILPYFCGFISTYALFFYQGIKMRLVFIVAHVSWIIYAVSEGSLPGVALNSMMILGHLRTIWKISREGVTHANPHT